MKAESITRIHEILKRDVESGRLIRSRTEE